MSEYIKNLTIVLLSFTLLNLVGCVRALLPTSDEELVSKSVNKGYEAEIDLNYVDAYLNLKKAYESCIAYKSMTDSSYIAVYPKLDRDSKMATIYANSNFNTYLSKVTLTEVNPNKTRINLFLARSKLLTENKNLSVGEKRLEHEINRALGLDKKCNSNK